MNPLIKMAESVRHWTPTTGRKNPVEVKVEEPVKKKTTKKTKTKKSEE